VAALMQAARHLRQPASTGQPMRIVAAISHPLQARCPAGFPVTTSQVKMFAHLFTFRGHFGSRIKNRLHLQNARGSAGR
jgi:hypothetical protein